MRHAKLNNSKKIKHNIYVIKSFMLRANTRVFLLVSYLASRTLWLGGGGGGGIRDFSYYYSVTLLQSNRISTHSAWNGNLEVPVYFLKAKQGYTDRKKLKGRLYVSIHIGKCRYQIKKQKEVSVWCTGIYRPISSTEHENKSVLRPSDVEEWTLKNSPIPASFNNCTPAAAFM
jgi:hypothetical protein